MSIQEVVLLEIGRTKWPRWIVYHAVRDRYWYKDRWVERPRDGELWNNKVEAEQARREAVAADSTGVEDD